MACLSCTDQCLLLQLWSGSVEDEHWLDVVVEQFTDAVEENYQVSIGNWLSMAIAKTLHCLVQPDANIYTSLYM